MYNESKGLREKDQDLLQVSRSFDLNMRHGIKVKVNLLKFKVDDQCSCGLCGLNRNAFVKDSNYPVHQKSSLTF